MQGYQNISRSFILFKRIVTILFLVGFVWLVSLPIINFNMMYPEQPIMYLINQQVHSFGDLINVYLHPQMMTFTIPFFRPSGHFLIYQLLYQLIDPHNLKALIIVNLLFLVMSGCLIIKIYQLLFPNFKMGGYIAFAIYLMHPALILSRMISLHFEFAYVFFLLASLYCFIRFLICYVEKFQANIWLLSSIIFYVFSVTFKESAVFLGPSLITYFLIFTYQSQRPLVFLRDSFQKSRSVLLLLAVTSMTLIVYLTLPWPTMVNPVNASNFSGNIGYGIFEFFRFVFNLQFRTPNPLDAQLFFRIIVFTLATTIVLWISIVASVATWILIRKKSGVKVRQYKQAFLFFLISALLYCILPLLWGKTHAWHFSLTILMLSFIAGFSFDYLSFEFLTLKLNQTIFCGFVALVIASQAYWNNLAVVQLISQTSKFSLELKTLKNAILNPPDIKSQLTPNSVIVVQDAILRDDYLMSGGQVYPLMAFQRFPGFSVSKMYDLSQGIFGNTFFKLEYVYSGTLFRFAYLMPDLREMPYPFDVNEMGDVESIVLYVWLQEYNNIFCLGYDEKGRWHDLTERFKKNLVSEKLKRSIEINVYKEHSFVSLKGIILKSDILAYPDVKYCQYECDQQSLCQGFNYVNYFANGKRVTKCEYYQTKDEDTVPCLACSSYVKT